MINKFFDIVFNFRDDYEARIFYRLYAALRLEILQPVLLGDIKDVVAGFVNIDSKARKRGSYRIAFGTA